jgi:hypothetical protein
MEKDLNALQAQVDGCSFRSDLPRKSDRNQFARSLRQKHGEEDRARCYSTFE